MRQIARERLVEDGAQRRRGRVVGTIDGNGDGDFQYVIVKKAMPCHYPVYDEWNSSMPSQQKDPVTGADWRMYFANWGDFLCSA